jgi:predicted DNA-binding transcriptional regulator AlpA
MNSSAIAMRRIRRPAAAAYMGVSRGFLEKAAVTGDGPPYLRLSARLVVYDIADLDDWMAARRVRSAAEVAERKRTAV